MNALIYARLWSCPWAIIEKVLIDLVGRLFRNLGMEVYTNLVIGGLELDLVAVEDLGDRSAVYVVEVKSKPKSRLLDQVLSRIRISDYVYAALPARHYLYLFEIPEPIGSLVIDLENMAIYEIRKPRYLGNGRRILESLRSRPLQRSQTPRTDARHTSPRQVGLPPT